MYFHCSLIREEQKPRGTTITDGSQKSWMLMLEKCFWDMAKIMEGIKRMSSFSHDPSGNWWFHWGKHKSRVAWGGEALKTLWGSAWRENIHLLLNSVSFCPHTSGCLGFCLDLPLFPQTSPSLLHFCSVQVIHQWMVAITLPWGKGRFYFSALIDR